MRLSKSFKIILFNIFVFFLFLHLINLFFIISYKVYHEISKKNVIVDERVSLPNYENLSWASTYFKEYDRLDFEYQPYYSYYY